MRGMDQSAQCQNCDTIFDTPGVAIGKTAIVLCPRCKKAVVVQGQVDPQDAAPTGPVPGGPDRTNPGRAIPDRTGPIPRPVADRTGPVPRPERDRTGPIAIPGLSTGPISIPGLERNAPAPGLDRLDRTGPVHTGPVGTGSIEKDRVKEEDSHAWRTRPISERPIVDREKRAEEPPPKPAESEQAATGKLVAMGFFTVACIAFLAVRVYHFYHPPLPPEQAARIDANDHAFQGITPVTENGVAVAVIADHYARALAGASERQICANAWFQGLRIAKIRTETGHPVADCSFLIRQHR